MFGRFKFLVTMVLLVVFSFPSSGFSARIKDIASIKGIRPNQLFGYGLIVGLNGSGDGKGTGFTIQGLANMLERMGIHVNPDDLKVKNVAAVIVSATLPPFARIGKKIDVTLSSIGDAKSLQGGTLLLTPLKGVDGKVYALAQGALALGGFSAGGSAGGGVIKNHPTVGSISGGATVEREISLSITDKKEFTIILDNPDFNTVTRVARKINVHIDNGVARPIDSGTLKFIIPERFNGSIINLIAAIENLEVEPDSVAKVIVNEKTGTVVIGQKVRIQEVAVAHGNLSIQIKETKTVSQPAPFSNTSSIGRRGRDIGGGGAPVRAKDGTIVAPGGSTVVVPDSDVAVTEEESQLLLVPEGRTIGELVKALNAIGVTPRDLITILQAMKAAGALQGQLEIL